MSDTIGPNFTEEIHACTFCQRHEVDADTLDYSENVRLAYQGHNVLQGAANGCIFFQDYLSILKPILKHEGFQDSHRSANFRPQKWVYAITISKMRSPKFETASGQWTCAAGELLHNHRIASDWHANYLLLASKGRSCSSQS